MFIPRSIRHSSNFWLYSTSTVTLLSIFTPVEVVPARSPANSKANNSSILVSAGAFSINIARAYRNDEIIVQIELFDDPIFKKPSRRFRFLVGSVQNFGSKPVDRAEFTRERFTAAWFIDHLPLHARS